MRRFKYYFIVFLVVVGFIGAGCSSDSAKVAGAIEKGRGLFEKKDYKGAETAYHEAVQTSPDSVEAWSGLAATRLKLGNIKGAVDAYQHILTIEPLNVEARLQMARFDVLDGQLGEAEKTVHQVLETAPENIRALLLMADIYIRANRLQDAQAVYQQIIALSPRETEAYIGLARLLVADGDMAGAESLLKKAADNNSEDVRTRLMLFNLYTAQQDDEAAEKVMSQTMAIHPDKALLPILLGRFYMARQQAEKAEKAFLDAIKKEPDNVVPYLVAGKFYEVMGKAEQKKKLYLQALDSHPKNIMIRQALAESYLKDNEVGPAEKQIATILETRPGYFPAQLLEIQRLIAAKEYTQALKQCDALLVDRGDPREAVDLYYLKGIAHLKKKELKKAEAVFLSALKKSPDSVAPRLMLARIYLKQGRADKAHRINRQIFSLLHKNFDVNLILGQTRLKVKPEQKSLDSFQTLSEFAAVNPLRYLREGHKDTLQKQYDILIEGFEKSLLNDPGQVGLFENIIVLHAARDEYDLALAKCERQLERLGPTSAAAAPIYNIKGGLLLAKNRIAEARQAFQQSINADPDFLKPYYGLARIYLMEKDIDKAIAQYRAVLEKNPRQDGPHVLLGALYKLQGNYAQAEKHYRKALIIKPNSLQAANNLAYLLSEYTGNLDDALYFALKAKAIQGDDPFVRDTLGWVYYKKGLYADALRELEASRQDLPDNAIVHYHLGMTLYKMSRPDVATRYLKKALTIDDDFEQAETAQEILKKLQQGAATKQ